MKMGARLAASFLLLAAAIIGLAAYTYYAVQVTDSYVNNLYETDLIPVRALGKANSEMHELSLWLYDYALDPTQRMRLASDMDVNFTRIDDDLAIYAAAGTLDAEQVQLFREVERVWRLYRTALEQAMVQLASSSGVEDAVLVLERSGLKEHEVALDNAISAMLDNAMQHATATQEASDKQLGWTITLLVVVAIIAVFFAIGLGLLTAWRITSNLGKMTRSATLMAAGDLAQRVEVHTGDEIEELANAFNIMADNLQARVETEQNNSASLQHAVATYSVFADRVASGDLTARIDGRFEGELAQLAAQLNEMVVHLAELSLDLRTGTQGIGAAATEILATVSEHTASANQQSAAINEVTATVSEAQASAQQVVAKAGDVAQLAQDTVRVGQDGAESVDAILKEMQNIRSQVENIAQNIFSLSEQTQQIGDIISSVTDIADQSNILAINAAIEAAKAGEQGKGFAVVAGEVRNLAEQSKQATAKVRTILVDIQKATNTAVLVTEQGTRGVEAGVTLTQRAGAVINQLAGAIYNASQAAQQISAASRQQNLAMDQIAQAMREINQATLQFVTGARQSQSAAEGLTTLAHQLQATAERYQV
jgi:methyl-accepting chemotaxis protein